MYSAKVTLKYDSTWEQTRGIYDEEMIPEEHITFEAPVEDMNTIQLFQLFSKFAAAMGHNEAGIAKGAAYVAFNEMRTTEDMRKTADDYDVILVEDYRKKLEEYDAQQDKELKKLEAQIRDLKAKLSRCQNPDNPNYTDEEMDAMTAEYHKEWKGLVPGSSSAVMMGCKCPVMDNEEMPDDKKWVNGDCPLHGKVK
jgi:hypothetical protein